MSVVASIGVGRSRSKKTKRVNASNGMQTHATVGGPLSDIGQQARSVGRYLRKSPMGRAIGSTTEAAAKTVSEAAKTATQAAKTAGQIGYAVGNAGWELGLGAAKVATSPVYLIAHALT
jgi:hypothetical protein